MYKGCLNHLRAQFGASRLTDITPAAVAAFVTEQQCRGFKGWTIKGQLNVLSAVYKHASRHLGFVGRNPVTLLDRVERPGIDDQQEKRTLDPEEMGRLVAAVDEPYRLIFEFAAQTGARLGEVLGIVWGEVDLDDATVTFTHQLARGGKRVPLKTKRSRRCIEITHELGEIRVEPLLAADWSNRSAHHSVRRPAPRRRR